MKLLSRVGFWLVLFWDVSLEGRNLGCRFFKTRTLGKQSFAGAKIARICMEIFFRANGVWECGKQNGRLS